eukprot:TRINITY_DN5449_c0_g1_i1.p1 TRINITY_DN5449_c0_g1~~TRINITY_DN5449_c0_g1_i1.p1  ORF type:complete len:379 (+),score=64.36 TRINITY_DN5449_c0_g1_i1:43-1179(+)
MEVVLATSDGVRHIIEIGPSCMGADIKREAGQLMEMEADLLEVQFEGTTIKDSEEVSDLGVGAGDELCIVLSEKEVALRYIAAHVPYPHLPMWHVIEKNDVLLLEMLDKAEKLNVRDIAIDKRLLKADKVMNYLLSHPSASRFLMESSPLLLNTSVLLSDAALFKRFVELGAARQDAPSFTCVLLKVGLPDQLECFVQYYLENPSGKETRSFVLRTLIRRYHSVSESHQISRIVRRGIRRYKYFPSEAFFTAVVFSKWEWVDDILNHCTELLAPVDITQYRNFSEQGIRYLGVLIDKFPLQLRGAAVLAGTMLQRRKSTPEILKKLLNEGVPEEVAVKIGSVEQLEVVLQCVRSDAEREMVEQTAAKRLAIIRTRSSI